MGIGQSADTLSTASVQESRVCLTSSSCDSMRHVQLQLVSEYNKVDCTGALVLSTVDCSDWRTKRANIVNWGVLLVASLDGEAQADLKKLPRLAQAFYLTEDCEFMGRYHPGQE